MSEQIKEKLDLLSEYQSQKDAIMLKKQEVIDSILAPEIKAQIAEVEAEFASKAEAVTDKIAILESEIKKDVLSFGQSVKGTFLHAIFVKGRVSWDTKALDGYIKAHPELASLRKEGEPSVSLRVAK